MKKVYSDAERQVVVNRYIQGETVTSISNVTSIARGTIYAWIKNAQEEQYNSRNINLRDVHFLRQAVERQKKIIEILRLSPCAPSAPLADRYAVITNLSNQYNESLLCETLSVAKGSYYNFKLRGKQGHTVYDAKKEKMTPIIEQLYHESQQVFGPGKIQAILKDRGYAISQKTVANIMHQNGWFSIRPSSKRMYLQAEERKRNLLNQQFHVTQPNEVWVSDITYFRYNNRMYYICVILDLYARKVVAHRISEKNSTQLSKGTFKKAYENRSPTKLLFHSDRGANYVSKTFMTYLKNLDVKQSFSNPGVPYDNSVMESFFKSLKSEKLYRIELRSKRELWKAVDDYIYFYNNKRPHYVLSNRTPEAYEAAFYSKQKDSPNR